MIPRIAVYGGAFDPPQLAHEAIAREAVRMLGLERLYIVPSGPHEFKTYKSSPESRKRMIEIFIGSLGSDRIELCDVFLDGKIKNTTLETDRYFRESLGYSPYQIFGSDLIDAMWKWDPTGEVAMKLPKIIIKRPGYEIDESKIANFVVFNPFGNSEVSELSSTQVRDNIRNNIYVGMNPVLSDYIKKNQIYS